MIGKCMRKLGRSSTRRRVLQYKSLRLCSSDTKEDVIVVETSTPSDSKSGSEKLHQLRGLSDNEVVDLVMDGKVSQYKLEREIKKSIMAGNEPDCERAVRVRRLWLEKIVGKNQEDELSRSASMSTDTVDSSRGLPYDTFDTNNFYGQVLGKNCENVIGFVRF